MRYYEEDIVQIEQHCVFRMCRVATNDVLRNVLHDRSAIRSSILRRTVRFMIRHRALVLLLSIDNFFFFFFDCPISCLGKNASRDFTQASSIDYLYNQFWFPQNNTHLNVQIVNIETLVLREGFWGYFGRTENVAKMSLSTEGSSFFGAGPSLVSVLFPRKEINQKQIL